MLRLTGGVLAGAASIMIGAAPAEAWGPLTHGAIAQRSYAVLVTREAWLAPHREAFLWGAMAADVHESPGAGHLNASRTHGASTLAELWREAQPAGAGARAFVLGWAAHLAADEVRAGWAAARRMAVREALARAGTAAPPPEDDPAAEALLDLAVDAAVAPRTGGLLRELAVAAWHHAGTPAGAPLTGLFRRVLGVDEPTYMALAGLTTSMAARGTDRYLQERARFGRVERWLEPARAAGTRAAIGDPVPLLTEAAERGVTKLERLLDRKR